MLGQNLSSIHGLLKAIYIKLFLDDFNHNLSRQYFFWVLVIFFFWFFFRILITIAPIGLQISAAKTIAHTVSLALWYDCVFLRKFRCFSCFKNHITVLYPEFGVMERKGLNVYITFHRDYRRVWRKQPLTIARGLLGYRYQSYITYIYY